MIYFNSRYLSERLEIKPAKWKRWAREFLEPDPLGGYRSGYARQFSHKDAFRVFLGGHLVSEQKFTIPDARQILHDLDAWFIKNGFYARPHPTLQPSQAINHIYVYNLPDGKLAYAVRTIKKRQSGAANSLCAEYYTLSLIGSGSDLLGADKIVHARILVINALYCFFTERVGLT